MGSISSTVEPPHTQLSSPYFLSILDVTHMINSSTDFVGSKVMHRATCAMGEPGNEVKSLACLGTLNIFACYVSVNVMLQGAPTEHIWNVWF